MRLSTAVLLAVVTGAGIAAAAEWILFVAFHPQRGGTSVDVTKLALTVAGGVGGVVALVIAYRRQRDVEQGRFVERFSAAAAQLGAPDVAVRIAGVYAMAGVADESEGLRRQQCIDVLCGYLRLPYDAEHGSSGRTKKVVTTANPRSADGADESGKVEEHHEYRSNDREVRATILRVIADHLRSWAEYSWSRSDFDFRTAYLEEVDLSHARFSRTAQFGRATFAGTAVFSGATFAGSAGFDGATFAGTAMFSGTAFAGSARFNGATFADDTWFDEATFTGTAWFGDAIFDGADTWFPTATFTGDALFGSATFAGDAWFGGTTFAGATQFGGTSFDGASSFGGTTFGGAASFDGAMFAGEARFGGATFADDASFGGAAFAGGARFDEVMFAGKRAADFVSTEFGRRRVTFEDPERWGPPAPRFAWDDDPQRKPANVLPDPWPPVVGGNAATPN
jgi:uncharacterized protein YjbI with pentapeptide repeats